MNNLKVSKAKYQELLNLFPEAWREKLKLYTGEELYYAYRLCLFAPRRDKETGDLRLGDVTLLSLKAKLIRYLKGISIDDYNRPPQPIWPAAWIKLGRKWAQDFNEEYVHTEPVVQAKEISKLANAFNNKRIA